MAIRPPAWCAGAVPERSKGWVDPNSGELLVSSRFTQAQIDEFYGIPSIEEVQVVHEEIRVPKSFAPYSEGKQFKGYVNGVEVDQRAILNDPYTSDGTSIVHFLITKNELVRINEALGTDNFDNKKMDFK